MPPQERGARKERKPRKKRPESAPAVNPASTEPVVPPQPTATENQARQTVLARLEGHRGATETAPTQQQQETRVISAPEATRGTSPENLRAVETGGQGEANEKKAEPEGKGFLATLADDATKAKEMFKEMGDDTKVGRVAKWALKLTGWVGGFLFGGVAMLLHAINKNFFGGTDSKASK